MIALRLATPLLLLALGGCSENTAKAVSASVVSRTSDLAASQEPPPDSDKRDGDDPDADKPAGPALQLREVEITDPARRKRVAYRLLAPKGWEVEGGVTAVGSAYHMIPTISDVVVRAPDGRGVRFWSMLEYGWADGLVGQFGSPFDGRPAFPIPKSLGEHWRRLFQAFPAEGVTGLEIVSEEVQRDETKQVRKMMAPFYESTKQENAQLRFTGESKEFDVEVRRLVIRYSDHGKPIEATIFAALRKTIYRYPNRSIRAAMWNLDYMYALFGPKGSDYTVDPVLAAIVRSRREDTGWQEEIQRWYLAKNRQIVMEGRAKIAAAARAAVTTRSAQTQDVLDISFQGWKSRNAASDAGQASVVNSIHERTTYAQPGGTSIDLPSYYQNVYADGQGNYVLHNDANWEIGADPAWNQRDWQRIEPQR